MKMMMHRADDPGMMTKEGERRRADDSRTMIKGLMMMLKQAVQEDQN